VAQEFLFISASGAFRPFKVIQGQYIWVPIESAYVLPISP